MRAHIAPRAENDLEKVGDYIALENPNCAFQFIREIRQHCEKIVDGPQHYMARAKLGDSPRICTHGNDLIVFEPFDDGALLLRVLHGALNGPEFSAATDLLLSASHGCQSSLTLSTSIAFYRPQATLFAGKCDGKIGAPRHEVICFQLLTGAGGD